MDPNKFASAPPMENRRGEKSFMGQMPPPAYQDTANPGYWPGYNPLPQGFGPPPPPYVGEGCVPQPYPMGQQYPGQLTTVRPVAYVARGPLAHPVNDYLGYSIFTLLCCCLPIGIAALIYSISAREANHAGDQMQAERSSKTARMLNHVALGIGLGFLILTIVFAGVMVTDF